MYVYTFFSLIISVLFLQKGMCSSDVYLHEDSTSRSPFSKIWLDDMDLDPLFEGHNVETISQVNQRGSLKKLEYLMQNPPFPEGRKKEPDFFYQRYAELYLESIKRKDSSVEAILLNGHNQGWFPVEFLNLNTLFDWVWMNPEKRGGLLPFFEDTQVVHRVISEKRPLDKLFYFLVSRLRNEQVALILKAEERLDGSQMFECWAQVIRSYNSSVQENSEKSLSFYHILKSFLKTRFLQNNSAQRKPYFEIALEINNEIFRKNFIGTLQDATRTNRRFQEMVIDEFWEISAEKSDVDMMQTMLDVYVDPSQDAIERSFESAKRRSDRLVLKFFKDQLGSAANGKVVPSLEVLNDWQNPNQNTKQDGCCAVM